MLSILLSKDCASSQTRSSIKCHPLDEECQMRRHLQVCLREELKTRNQLAPGRLRSHMLLDFKLTSSQVCSAELMTWL